MRNIVVSILLVVATNLTAQKVGTGFDFTLNLLVESGLKKFSDIKGKPSTVMADDYFNQFESNLLLQYFKYNLVTEYPTGNMNFFTGIFLQTHHRKKAIQYYDFLVSRVEQAKIKCCTMKRESGINLENEKTTYYKAFARPNEYSKLQFKVALETYPGKNGKLDYYVIFYLYSNPSN